MRAARAVGIGLVLCLPAAAVHADPLSDGTRVEPRVLVKKHRLFFSAGPGWFARGDYYNSPGVLASVTYYPIESGGIELRGAFFKSFLDSGAAEILEHYHAVPDAQSPTALAMAGWRQTVAYGKLVAANGMGPVVHFDLQATGHVGSVITNQAVNPAGSVGIAALFRIYGFNVQFDLPFVLSREITRSRSVATGVLPVIGIGGSL